MHDPNLASAPRQQERAVEGIRPVNGGVRVGMGVGGGEGWRAEAGRGGGRGKAAQ